MIGADMEHGRRVWLASVVVLTKGILNLALGVLHIVGTFTFESTKIASELSGELRRDYLVWFYGVGVFIVFMGALDIACYSGVREKAPVAWRVAVLCSIFNFILGMSGVAVFGVSPPLQLLVTGVVGLVVLGIAREPKLNTSMAANTTAQ